MQYLFLIYDDEKNQPPRADIMEAYGRFSEEVNRRSLFVGANRLRPTEDATTVRVRNGETVTTDGPFAETKEQLGGYYLLDCKDLDEALEVAAKIPTAAHGSIEVRPVWAM
jgi:hypothetical protein